MFLSKVSVGNPGIVWKLCQQDLDGGMGSFAIGHRVLFQMLSCQWFQQNLPTEFRAVLLRAGGGATKSYASLRPVMQVRSTTNVHFYRTLPDTALATPPAPLGCVLLLVGKIA